MRNGKIIVGGAAVVLLSTAFSFNTLLNNDDSSSTYVPRTHVFSMEDKSVADQQADYERRRINLATGLYEPEVIKAAREEAIRYNKTARERAVTMGLTELGPDNIGGRTRAIVVDPRDQNHMITGSVSGQLYETHDRGNTWNKITSFPTVAIGSIAMSDVPPYRILVGIVDSWDPVGQGDGIWESTDDGATWSQIAGTAGYDAVNEIISVPGQDKFIIGCSAGLREYDGTSITTPANAPSGGVLSLSVSKDQQIMIGFFSPSSKRISTDGGASWSTISNADVGLGQRVEYAISDVKVSGKYYVYASVTNAELVSEHISTSNGEPGTWSETATNSTLFNPFNTQGRYNSCISVYPGRADKIVLGGIDLYDWVMDPGSNPAFGQWAQKSFWAASPQSPIYVHADNHFFAWNPDGDMIICNDGGIGISPAQAVGQVFFPANKGYNVTQFYNIGYSAHGHVIGGTQDNGTLHNNYTNNSFKEFEEVLGGDGFSADISILNEEVLFGSLYYGGFSRSNDGGFTWGSFTSGQMNSCGAFGATSGGVGGFNTVTRLWETNNDVNSTDSLMFIPNSTMNPGDTAVIESASLGIELTQILTNTMTVIDTLNPDGTVVQGTDTLNYFLNPQNGDTIDISFDDYLVNVALDTLMIQDKIQSWYGFGVQFGSCEGVWLTRDAIRFSNTPFWWRFEEDDAGTNITGISDIEFSKDGNHMYIGTSENFGSSGNLYRVSGLNTLYANQYDAGWSASDPSILPASVTVTRIYSGSNISGICVDPMDPDHVVITHAGFGTSQIRRTTTATSDGQATGVGSFSNIHGTLPAMPVYDVEIHRDYATNGLIVIGTEFGIYATDNGSTWDVISTQNDLGMTPVYSVRQNWRGFNEGSYRPGELYFGTFGAGIWASADFLSTPDDITDQEPGVNFIASLNVYPNPMSTNGNIAFEMNERSNVTIEVYSLGGRLVKRINAGSMGQGSHTLDINVEDMSNGTYIVNMIAGQSKKTAKIIVNR